MNKLILALTFLAITACVPQVYEPTINNIVIAGDSNSCGFGGKMAAEFLGVVNNCKVGRSIHDIDTLPDVDLVFLELGINDPRSEQEFTDQLNSMLSSTAAVVVCVLPVALDSRADMPRQVMKNNCVEWLDPYDAGIIIQQFYAGNYDGVHYTDEASQYNMSLAYKDHDAWKLLMSDSL